MQINEVEKRTGITCHNIRFYEKEGLIHPSRNLSNGYREYSESDITRMNHIKLLRMLDISVKDIRIYLEKEKTLSDILREHLNALETEKTRIEQNLLLCQELVSMEFDDLSENTLEQMLCHKEAYVNSLEKIKKQDKIENLFFFSGQFFCVLGCIIALIIMLYFYVTLYLAYMSRPFQIILILLAIFLFGCIARIVLYNERKR